MNSSDMVFVAVEHVSAKDRQGRELTADDVEEIWTETLVRFRGLRDAALAALTYTGGEAQDRLAARLADADEWLAGVATGL